MTLSMGMIDPGDPDVIEQLAVDLHRGQWPDWRKLTPAQQRLYRGRATRTLLRLAALTRTSDAR